MDIYLYPKSKILGALLKKQQLKIATAESCTGGGLAFHITSVSGSSDYLERGFVTYTNESKIELLGVDPAILDKHGAVSKEVAAEMVRGALKNSQADLAFSITGVAGPLGGSPEKPVGTVWFGLALRSGICETRKMFFSPGRSHVRAQAIGFALDWLNVTLEAYR